MFSRRFTSPRVRKERRKRLLILLAIRAGLVIAVLFLLSQLFRIPHTRISEISFIGNSAVSTDDLAGIVMPELEESYFLLIPKRNSIFYPRDGIRRAVLEAFPRVRSVTVRQESLRAIRVSVVERKTVALWCRESGENPCYFIDSEGYAFAPSSRMAGNAHVTYMSLQPQDPIGTHVLPSDEFREVQKFIQNIKKLNLTISSVHIFGDYLEATLQTYNKKEKSFGPTKLIFSRGQYEDSLNTLRAVLQSKEFIEAHTSIAALEYIDIRFGNKVFFKLKGEMDTMENQETETL